MDDGPKTDFWLARKSGLLLCVSGGVLLLAARAGRVTREIALLGVLQAAALRVVDLVGVFEPRTTPIYPLDAIAEIAMTTGWCFPGAASRAETEEVSPCAKYATDRTRASGWSRIKKRRDKAKLRFSTHPNPCLN